MLTFESHLNSLNENTRKLANDLRNFVLSLGPQVIEEVRPHRIAYAKTLNFRVFLELVSSQDSINLVIRAGRAGPPVSIQVKDAAGLSDAKKQIAWAFEKIQ